MQNVIITTECVADLPSELVEKYNIGIIYYMIKTDKGEFRDTDEISASNVMEYMMGGEKMAQSIIPSVSDYLAFFKEELSSYEEILHIAISNLVSTAYANAKEAISQLGEDGSRVHLIDSKHLSSGLGLLVLEAAMAIREGKTTEETVQYITGLTDKVSTSFLAYNADYLYYNGKVSERVKNFCNNLTLHPALVMSDGKLALYNVYIGRYLNAARKYIRKTLRNRKSIKKEFAFITYAGLDHKSLETVRSEVESMVKFDTIIEQKASASISCNCGPNTFGVIYINKE